MQEEKKVHLRLVRHKWADEIEIEKKKKRKNIAIISAITVSFVMGMLLSYVFFVPSNTNYQSKDSAIFESVYRIMGNKWYFSKDNENIKDDLMYDAITGMVNGQGDPHTVYMNAEQVKQFSSSLNNSIIGIGVRYIRNDGYVLVREVLNGSPAEASGIQSGDLITKVDGVDLAPLSDEEVQNRVRGEVNSEVTVTILRDGETKDVKIIRKEIYTSVTSKILDNNIGYIQINSFSTQTAEELKVHLDGMVANSVNKLVLDLRDNGGGYLHTLLKMASYFLPEDVVVLQQEYVDGTIQLSKTSTGMYDFDDLVLLVNENSASCSEVFAAALREQRGVKIVGTTTYGKGTVQVSQAFGDGSALKYTVAAWLTPNGESINGVGVTPDYEVRLDDALYLPYFAFEEDEVYHYDTVNEQVAAMQKILRFLDYPMKRVDGYFDQQTYHQLKEFQKDHGIEATGDLDYKTSNTLNQAVILNWSSNRMKYDVQLKKALEVLHG